MSHILSAMPALCEPAPPRHSQAKPDPALVSQLDDFHKLTAYSDLVWGPAKWTALESEILTLPAKLDEHEFCMFKVYLALNARYLPCINCARHFEEHIQRMPNDDVMRTRAGLLKWFTDVHNDVNRRKHREELSHEEIIRVLGQKANAAAAAVAVVGDGGAGAGEGDSEKKNTPSAIPEKKGSLRSQTSSQDSDLTTLLISLVALLVAGFGFSILSKHLARAGRSSR